MKTSPPLCGYRRFDDDPKQLLVIGIERLEAGRVSQTILSVHFLSNLWSQRGCSVQIEGLFPFNQQLPGSSSHQLGRVEEFSMSGHESEQVLILLKELSVLKQLDSEYESGSKTNSEEDAHRQRQRRHREIAEEIKALADRD